MSNPIDEERDDLLALVTALISEATACGLDVHKVLAAQMAKAFERGVRMGVHMRCAEITAGLISTRSTGNPAAAHIHSDACLLEAQQVMHAAIPGVIELPELIADYGHNSFATGYHQGVEEQEAWGDPEEEL